MYDLATDPCEQTHIANTEKSKVVSGLVHGSTRCATVPAPLAALWRTRRRGRSREHGEKQRAKSLLYDLIFISQVKIFSSGRALHATLRAAP
jgi:hypothetical protein